MQRYAIGIEFCGTQYRGWQTQQAGVITVQESIEKVLSSIANEPIVLHGAGRTDAGVHATNMVAHFDTDAARPELGWIRGANSQLPKDISIQWIKCMDENFMLVLKPWHDVIVMWCITHPLAPPYYISK